jgi:phosphomannomutase/phosphoglucomutase
VNPKVFREYDIRGVADRDLDDMLCRDLGAVFARRLVSAGKSPTVVVGRDCRTHSPRIFNALTMGLRTSCEVTDIGVVPSPVLYFAADRLHPGGAIMITGSHNPAEDNGFKLMIGSNTLHGTDIADLRDDVLALRRHGATLTPPIVPMKARTVDAHYIAYARSQLRLGPRRFKIVVDAGNGAGGPIAVELYRALGFEVVPLYCEMDGTFPNHHPDPTVPENLRDLIAKVAAEGAEVGIALDGDADRVGAVDSAGRILWGDQLMVLLGKAVLAEVPGARFVGEVKCSQSMFDQLAAAGGHPEMWKVGHSLIKARMRETGAQLAGEMSGHIFFAHRYLGFDDAIYAGARLLELLTHGTRSLREHVDELPVAINTPEIRLDCDDGTKFDVVTRVTATLRQHPQVHAVVTVDGVRASFGDGWGLVRASNTQAALVLRCEAATHERLSAIRAILEGAIREAQRAA